MRERSDPPSQTPRSQHTVLLSTAGVRLLGTKIYQRFKGVYPTMWVRMRWFVGGVGCFVAAQPSRSVRLSGSLNSGLPH